jgi:thiamine kinase-like enzyme
MQFKNILKNRVYISPLNENIFDEDILDLMQTIFKHAKLNIPEKHQIEFIDSNYNYDIYKVYFLDQSVCVKISFNEKDLSLKEEFTFYKKNNNIIHPKSIKYNSLKYGNNLNYLIISYEEFLPIKKIGYSIFLNNLNLFFNKFSALKSLKFSSKNIESVIESVFKYCDIDEVLPQHTIEIIKQKYDLNSFKNFISSLKLEIKNLCNNPIINQDNLCHGNLKPSNILYSENDIKFINFENCFLGNIYFDIACLSINFKLNSDLDKDFFKKYLSYNNENFSVEKWESYRLCYNIMLRKILLELIINYFFEVFVLTQSRPSKIYELISLYTYNVDNFYKINSFRENYNLISNIFSEAIIGIEDE